MKEDIQQIRTRISNRFSGEETSSKAENQFNFEKSLDLLKEQYLEIELGLNQLKKGESVQALDFLKKIREI